VTVIDPASPWAEEQALLNGALDGRRVDTIFLTHHHRDHISGVEALRRRTGARVVAHPLTASRIPFDVDAEIDAGFIVETDAGRWIAHHTPGHARGHLCLHREDDGYIVAGDMVAGVGTILLEPPEGHLGHYIDSLERLIALDPQCLLPAHGPEITDAVGYLQHYIDHRHHRTQQILEALAAATAPATPKMLVPTIYTELPQHFWGIAARQVLCHLLWLVEANTVRQLEDEERFEVIR